MEPTAPVPASAKTKASVILSLASATAPWDGRELFVPTLAPLAPTMWTVRGDVTAIMEPSVTTSMESVTANQDIKEKSAKSSVHTGGLAKDATRSADVRTEGVVIQLRDIAPVLKVGKALSAIKDHVTDQKSMALTVPCFVDAI